MALGLLLQGLALFPSPQTLHPGQAGLHDQPAYAAALAELSQLPGADTQPILCLNADETATGQDKGRESNPAPAHPGDHCPLCQMFGAVVVTPDLAFVDQAPSMGHGAVLAFVADTRVPAKGAPHVWLSRGPPALS